MSKAFISKCCNEPVRVAEFIQSCMAYWSPQEWLLYKCPRCSKQFHLKISNEVVHFGQLDGVPGPCFIQEFTQRIPGLTFNPAISEACISFMGISKNIQAK